MIEKRAVELAFPRSIFVTFNGSEFRCLFPRAAADLLHVFAAARREREALVPAACAADVAETADADRMPDREPVMSDYRLMPAGDTALVVEFGDRIDRRLSAGAGAGARV